MTAGTDLVSKAHARAVSQLEQELALALGPSGVSTDLEVRHKASVDGSTMSPVIVEQFPLGLADLVAFPRNAQEIGLVVGAAARHGVAVTPRGRGTGNYGQALPLEGGLVLDMTKAKAITEVGDGFITAEAGASMASLERAAAVTGQQLWMYPSTVQSTLGGFLAGGSGGTGTIVHGMNSQGFVVALDVVHPASNSGLQHLEGEAAQPFVHTYGTAGVIARATVRLEPLQQWHGLYASFADFHQAAHAVTALHGLSLAPRLVSADPPGIAQYLPADPAIPPGRSSLRAILDARTVAEATALVAGAGGQVETVRTDSQAAIRLSLLSYNHPVYWLQRAAPPNSYFHVEVARQALVDRLDEVQAVYPGGMLHLEAGHEFPIGMLVAPYRSAHDVIDGYAKLEQLGVRYHSPHQWYVDFNVDQARAVKAVVDPRGLLNPGKLVVPQSERAQPAALLSPVDPAH